MVLQINGTNVVNTDRSITLGTATPGAPVTGMMRYNSTLPEFQVYDGAAWVPFKKVVGGSDATLYAWGSPGAGVLGDNSTVEKSSPVSVVGGFTDWINVKAGYAAFGIRANGTLWGWGYNADGQVGDNSIIDKSSPVAVVGGFTWTNISAAKYHSIGVRSNGTLWGWGRNQYGQLGNNAVANRSSPVSVVGGFTDWVSASAGRTCSIGVRANGTLYAWGSNFNGQLGASLAQAASRSSPVLVSGGFTDWVDVSVGSGPVEHVVGLRANGTLYAWGYSSAGAMGIGVIAGRSSPVAVVGGFTDWKSLGTGHYHSLAIRANGTLYTWGSNQFGQLGNNSSTGTILPGISSPISVVGGFTDWVSAVGGGGHSLGIRANGTLYAWGYNNQGTIGNNSIVSRSSPVLVAGGFTDWVVIAANANSSFGLRG
jgi:alpha-tubulin suppressor-like RCC1 family protein